MKKVLLPVAVLLLCITAIGIWTRGFSAFTVFSYTLKNAGDMPRAFPDIEWIDQDSTVFHTRDKHKYLLVNFVYLSCPDVCHKVNNRLENIYHSVDSAIVPDQLELVTVSFDTQRDGLDRIKKYRELFSKDNIDGWSFAIPYKTSELEFSNFLKEMGVWIYEVPETGVINHSIYLFLISPDNKIVKVFDPAREDDPSIIKQLEQWVSGRQPSSLS
ncbi:MAG: SCO family protein [Chitinophagaceae bacterium]|nr:SCO family protein [Chitinophagaceae bacterium]